MTALRVRPTGAASDAVVAAAHRAAHSGDTLSPEDRIDARRASREIGHIGEHGDRLAVGIRELHIFSASNRGVFLREPAPRDGSAPSGVVGAERRSRHA